MVVPFFEVGAGAEGAAGAGDDAGAEGWFGVVPGEDGVEVVVGGGGEGV